MGFYALHSFLISISNQSTEAAINRAREKVHHFLSRHCDIQLEATPTGLSCLKGWIVQPVDQKFHLIRTFQNEQLEILFFGYLVNDLGQNDHQTLVSTYNKNGIEGISLLEGVFSCIIYNKQTESTHIANDLIGHRKLRIHQTSERTLVSPHDGFLLATGTIPKVINQIKQADSAQLGWALGAESFIDSIQTVPPFHFALCHDNELRFQPVTIKASAKPDRDNISEIVEELCQYTSNFSKGTAPIISDLTCGFDSRAVLGLLLNAQIDKTRLTVSTVGNEGSTDIIIAGQIAKTYGLKHNIIPTPFDAGSIEKVWERATYKAFLSNGDTHFKRALTSIPAALNHLWHTGEGGGIFKGFYFPAYNKAISLDEGISQLCISLNKGYVSSEEKDRFQTKLIDHLRYFEDVGSNPYSLMTSFFATEYIGVMGSIVSNFSWFPFKGSPFLSNRALAMSLNTKPSLLKQKRVHKAIIDRYLKEVKTIPINGQPYFLSFNPGLRKRFGRYFTQRIINHEKQKSQLLAKLFQNGLNDLVCNNIDKELIDSDRIPTNPVNRSEDKLMMAAAFNHLANLFDT